MAVEPGLNPHTGEDLLQVFGTIVLPGLHDHHLHLRSLVAAGRSIQVSPEEVRGRDELASTLQRAPVDRLGWRRAVGYHESVAGELNRWSLDALAPGPPTRVQHRSGTLWMVNSAAVDFLGLEALDTAGVERDEQGQATGRLVRMDDWLARRLPDEDPVTELAAVSRHMAARGLTGVTDATPDATPDGVDGLAGAVEDGRLLQRLHLMCAPHVDVPAHPLVTRGPQKVMLDDDRLPALDDLIDVMRCAHGCGVSVAVHCVTPAQLALTVAAFEAAGVRPGDRVEHGSVVAAEFIPVLARARLTLVTNPGFVFARGDSYLEDVDEHDVPFLYPCASLLDGGVTVAAGTDAPFGPADPWTAIRAAVSRRTRWRPVRRRVRSRVTRYGNRPLHRRGDSPRSSALGDGGAARRSLPAGRRRCARTRPVRRCRRHLGGRPPRASSRLTLVGSVAESHDLAIDHDMPRRPVAPGR